MMLSQEIRRRLFGLLLLAVVCGSITFSITHDNYQWFSRVLTATPPPGDTSDYLRSYLDPLEILRAAGTVAYRDYRLAAPLLAHLVPDPPPGAFKPTRQFDPVGLAVYKFAVLGGVFNFATSVLVYACCRWFQLSRLLSLLGAALYSTLTFVLLIDGIPHVDPVFFFVFGLGAYALLRRRFGWLLLTVLVGTFVKCCFSPITTTSPAANLSR